MKAIRFEPLARTEIRPIDQRNALAILETIHRYTETGAGNVKALSGEFAGMLRLRAGNSVSFSKRQSSRSPFIESEIAEKRTGRSPAIAGLIRD